MPRGKVKYIFFISILVFACTRGSNDSDKVVAKVSDKYLYLSEVDGFMPDNISASDSILMSEDYIRKWVQKELLIKKAEENLTSAQKDVSKEIEEYRNSLIIYRYKNEMVAQKMDTTVLDSEIEAYYKKNIGTFKLRRDIVKAVYIKIPANIANKEQLKILCSGNSGENLSELNEYCIQYAKSFDTFSNSWVEFYRVMNNVPNEINDYSQFLTRNKIYDYSDDDYYYLVWVRDYKLMGEDSPVEYVKNQIRNLILNRRKLEFLKNIEKDIYNDGVRNNKFNIYDVD